MPRTGLERTAAGLLAAFAALAVLVVAADEVPGDGLLSRVSAAGSARAIALRVDGLTGYAGTAVASALLVAVLVRHGRRRDALLCAVSVAGAVVGTTLLKELVGRPRPELLSASVAASPWSFPSGHAAVTAALAVTLVLAARGTRALVPAAVAGALLVLGAAAAQLGLALHRPSDVLGGWLWAAGWTAAVWAAGDPRAAR